MKKKFRNSLLEIFMNSIEPLLYVLISLGISLFIFYFFVDLLLVDWINNNFNENKVIVIYFSFFAIFIISICVTRLLVKKVLVLLKIESENTILKNKALLKELSENSIGVRKANDEEIDELNKRLATRRMSVILLLMLPLAGFALTIYSAFAVEIKYLLLMIPYLLVFIFILLMFQESVDIKNVKEELCLIIECDICDKKEALGRHGRAYKIKCRDKNKLYVDNWFSCNYKTYHNKKANIVVVKKKRKAYINSFDKIWRSISYVVRF